MYNRGIQELLDGLPDLSELTPEDIQRLLTSAWVEVLEQRELRGSSEDLRHASEVIRRLASSLEFHAVINSELSSATVEACAFVAAEGLDIALEIEQSLPTGAETWLFGSTRTFERIETALLYMIAGYDANASRSVAAADLVIAPSPVSDFESALSQEVISLLTLRSGPEIDQPIDYPVDASVGTIARARLMAMMCAFTRNHNRWLRFQDEEWTAAQDLQELLSLLDSERSGVRSPARHADLYHLGVLLLEAFKSTHTRALRLIPAPIGVSCVFLDYQRKQTVTRPLLWPAAIEFAKKVLPGPTGHAVVNVPTGAGKSAVADLAVAQAISQGWVLYLAPTNALVSQIRRQLGVTFGGLSGINLRQLQGGAEYTGSGEDLDQIGGHQIIVMTPEKCSLVLRQNPGVFDDLALCVVDEAHALGEPGARAAVLELVIAETMRWAPQSKFLLMSALVSNADELASWLETASGVPAHAVTSPWRPTRTLRALAGFVRKPTIEAAVVASEKLDNLPERRVKVAFNGEIGLLTSLQGTWQSTKPQDYVLVGTTVQAPLAVNRTGMDTAGYLNPAVGSLAQGLAEAGRKTLVFLSRSKHDGFSVAKKMQGLPTDGALPPSLDSILTVAEFELGVESQIRILLQKRIAVHSSAMIREEQRASEMAFEQGIATTLFATATLGQGLNLPANAVLIGGTEIGYDPTTTAVEKASRAQSQFLNAIGRAGRAHVAARSIAIVVPNQPVFLGDESDSSVLPRSAAFLKNDDASSEVRSQLENLVRTAVQGEVVFDDITPAEAAAFALLSFSGDGNDAGRVLGNSFAAYRSGASESGADVAAILGGLGAAYIEREQAPEWIAIAAHRAGVTVQRAVGLQRAIRALPLVSEGPTSIAGWLDLLVRVLQAIPVEALGTVLPRKHFESTSLAKAWSAGDSRAAWSDFRQALGRWVGGNSYAEILTRVGAPMSSGRSQQDQIPRLIRLVDKGFAHELSMLAGAMLSIVETAIEYADPDAWQLSDESMSTMERLPSAIRLGLDTASSLEWLQLGYRPRRVAKLLDSKFPAPEELSSSDARTWIRTKASTIRPAELSGLADPVERNVLAAALAILRSDRS